MFLELRKNRWLFSYWLMVAWRLADLFADVVLLPAQQVAGFVAGLSSTLLQCRARWASPASSFMEAYLASMAFLAVPRSFPSPEGTL